MNVPMSGRTDNRAERLLPGDSHPVFAAVAFAAVILFAAVPFLVDTDEPSFVIPSLIGCFTSFFVFLHLLVGLTGSFSSVKRNSLLIVISLGIAAGGQWYLMALIAGGTLLCTLFLIRLIGPHVPVIR